MNGTRIGLELSRLRRVAGLSQSDLARRMGTAQPVVSRVESGRVLPSLSMIDRFARATGQSLSMEFGSSENETPPAMRRERLKRVLGDYVFNPWDRSPSEAEARSLVADGLTRELFASESPPRRSGTRA